MEDQLSRRELLKKTVAGVSTAALFHAARWPASPSAASESAVAPASAGPANASAVLPLTSTSEAGPPRRLLGDRKSTRLNSNHGYISYAVFCLKKKKPAQRAAHDQPCPVTCVDALVR